MKLIKQIPNGLTLANLSLGMLAIVFAVESSEMMEVRNLITSEYHIVPNPIHINNLALASFLILLATLFDFADGFAARLLNAQSAIGGQLDSLADMVTFGVAPSLILYKLLGEAYSQQAESLGFSSMVLWPALFIGICGAIRLAKFNIDPEQSDEFKGLPIPAAALFVISLPLIILDNPFGINSILLNPYVLYGIILFIGLMMVSNRPMLTLKFKSFAWKDNQSRYMLIILCATSIIALQYLGIPIAILIYIGFSLISNNKTVNT